MFKKIFSDLNIPNIENIHIIYNKYREIKLEIINPTIHIINLLNYNIEFKYNF